MERDIAMVFQNYALYPHMDVGRNMSFSLKIAGVPADEVKAKVAAAAKILNIEHLLSRKPKDLSGGQRQRVAIARALILEPQILLLDEPTSALDASVQAEVLNLLDDLRQRRGLTYVMVSHDLAVVTHLCSRLMVMQGGRCVEMAAADDLAARRVHEPYTQALMAASEGFKREHTENGV
jgi:peptide/nickel transport system ATP-binding protein